MLDECLPNTFQDGVSMFCLGGYCVSDADWKQPHGMQFDENCSIVPYTMQQPLLPFLKGNLSSYCKLQLIWKALIPIMQLCFQCLSFWSHCTISWSRAYCKM